MGPLSIDFYLPGLPALSDDLDASASQAQLTLTACLYSILMLVTGLAPMLAPILGGQLLQVMSWRGLFVGLAIAGVFLLLGSVAWLAETLPQALRHAGSWRGTAHTFSRLVHDRVF